MYPVSGEFLAAVNANSRHSYWTGTIETKSHEIYAFEGKDIVKGSGYITRQCCGSSEIELGTVYAAELGISLFLDIDRYTLEDAQVKLFYHLVLPGGSVETVPMGIFEVSEANRTVKTLELTAYDYMLRFEKHLSLESSSGKPYDFLAVACTACDVELAHTEDEIKAMPNGNELLGIYEDNDIETYRDLLFYVAQVLGRFCQIDREGRLQLLPYGSAPVDTIPWTRRFESTYSDFVTRYTAVSSTNLRTEEAEYYAVEPDDGLTMNLGSNPLLQFGLKDTRERLLRNILTALTVVDYVPFDTTTIGNPALDPGDVLRFSGGHADESKLGCITSVTYKINGRQSLTCVGKNPKLALAKSKNDKNITGLINQVEAGKTIVYNFMNVSAIHVGTSPVNVMSIDFTSKEETTAQFLAEILFTVTADDVLRTVNGTATYEETDPVTGLPVTVEKQVQYAFMEKGHPELTVTYKMNDAEISAFVPEETCREGKHILNLFLPITQVLPRAQNTLAVFFRMTGGVLDIAEMHIRATISGQGLVAGLGEWNGKLQLEDTFGNLMIEEDMAYAPFTTSAQAVLPAQVPAGLFTETLGQLSVEAGSMSIDAFGGYVSAIDLADEEE